MLDEGRLPSRDALLQELVGAVLATKRHFHKPDRCKDRVIAPMLEYLGTVTPTDIELANDGYPHFAELLLSRSAIRKKVITACRRCQLCEYGRRLVLMRDEPLP